MSAPTWCNFVEATRKFGFEILEQRPFANPNSPEGYLPINLIAAHPRKYLLLHATSEKYGAQEKLNENTIYGCIDMSGVSVSEAARALLIVERDPLVGSPHVPFSYNSRTINFSIITELSKTFTFVPWGKNNRGCLISGYSPAEIANHRKAWKLFRVSKNTPKWVRDFIN